MSAACNPLRVTGAARPLDAAALILAHALGAFPREPDVTAIKLPPDDAPSVALEARFAGAMALYQTGHWARAFADLVELADLGHVPASRLALLMLRYGTGWFRTPFSATPGQVARWARQVLRSPAPAPASGSAVPRR